MDESDGEKSSDSGDTVSSSIAAILGPDMFSDGPCDAIDGGSKGGMLCVDRPNDADKWLESYNSGTRLTENASGHLCIGFDETIRKDPLGKFSWCDLATEGCKSNSNVFSSCGNLL